MKILKNKKQFKDACDKCGKMDYCRGFDGKVLCEKCIKKEMDKEKQERRVNDYVYEEEKNFS